MSADRRLLMLPAELQLQVVKQVMHIGLRELGNLRSTCRALAALGAELIVKLAHTDSTRPSKWARIKYGFTDQSLQVMEAVLCNPVLNPIITSVWVAFNIGTFITGDDGIITNFLWLGPEGAVDTPLERIPDDALSRPLNLEVNSHPFYMHLRATVIPRHNNRILATDLVKRTKRIMSEHLQVECAGQRHRERLGEILDLGTRLTHIVSTPNRQQNGVEKTLPIRPQWAGFVAFVDIASQGSRFHHMSLDIDAFDPNPDEEDANLVDIVCHAVAKVHDLTINHGPTWGHRFWSSIVIAAAGSLRSLVITADEHGSEFSEPIYELPEYAHPSSLVFPHLVKLDVEEVRLHLDLLMLILSTARESLRNLRLKHVDFQWYNHGWQTMLDYIDSDLHLDSASLESCGEVFDDFN